VVRQLRMDDSHIPQVGRAGDNANMEMAVSCRPPSVESLLLHGHDSEHATIQPTSMCVSSLHLQLKLNTNVKNFPFNTFLFSFSHGLLLALYHFYSLLIFKI